MVMSSHQQESDSIMAKNETVRIRPSLLQQDRDGFAALKAISDYKPANEDFTVSKVQTAQDELLSKRDTEAQKMGDWEAARDDATSAEWAFHNAMLAAKDQV